MITGCFAAPAFALLALALSRHGGHYDATSVGFVVLALAVSLAGACWHATPLGEARAARILPWLLGVVTIGNLAGLASRAPGTYLTAGTSLAPFRAGVFMAMAIAASYAVPAGRVRWLERARFPLCVAIFLALGAWTIHASPQPAIDVWHYHQHAAAVLLDGQNPWAADYPHIYANTEFIADVMLVNGRVASYTYPPLSLLLTVPGAMAGDARWSTLAAVAGAAVFAVAAARRRGVPAGHFAELGAVMLLFHTRSFFLIEQAWTDPFLALFAAMSAWAIAARQSLALAGAIAALVSVKQYGFILLPALWRHARTNVRALIVAGAVALAIHLPFVLWDPAALWRGVVLFQFVQPFRMDALSVLAWWAHVFGTVPSPAIGFVTATAAATLCWVRAPRNNGTPAVSLLAGAATYLAFFAFQKQASFNYYWFVSALLAIAVTTAPAESGRQAS